MHAYSYLARWSGVCHFSAAQSLVRETQRRRLKNILLFVGAILGTVFLIAGVVAIGRHDRSGWLYLVLAPFCYVLAADPGGRLRDFVSREIVGQVSVLKIGNPRYRRGWQTTFGERQRGKEDGYSSTACDVEYGATDDLF